MSCDKDAVERKALWHGRFHDTPDDEALAFETSIEVDMRLAAFDIAGSVAHAKMLKKIGLLTDEELNLIEGGLDGIKRDLESGAIAPDKTDEDIHSFIENTLTNRIGDAGKKLHTARSRNDQIALDERLWERDYIDKLRKKIKDLIKAICTVGEANLKTIMPGFTHTQHAQPVTLAHHLCAYGMQFARDLERLADCKKRVDISPIGSGALATSTFPLDRDFEARLLDFPAITNNSQDAVSDRDYFIELLADLSIIALHMSRLSTDIIFWSTSEAGFATLSERYSTGSSIMPQKKNADFAELIRGKTGGVIGSLVALLTTLKGLPLSYNRDLQEDKDPVFRACDTVDSCVTILTKMLLTMSFHVDKMAADSKKGFLNATDVAEYLVKKGLPFRDAHAVSASLVTKAESLEVTLEDLPIEDYKSASALFLDDVIDAIKIERCVENRSSPGGPASKETERQISILLEIINRS